MENGSDCVPDKGEAIARHILKKLMVYYFMYYYRTLYKIFVQYLSDNLHDCREV